MEILTTGREYFRKKPDEIDQEFRAFIVSESISDVVKKKLHEEWFKHTIENNASMPFGKKTLKEKKKYSKEIKLRKIVILLTITLIIY